MKKLLLIILILFSIINISAQDAITIDQNGNVLFKLIDKTASVDLKSTATPFDLSSYATVEKIGFRFRVSWFDGDGTNQFTFAESTPAYAIDNIPATEWIGHGIGHLDLVYDGENNFEVINAGEVWDLDGGKFASKTFEKDIDGSFQQIVTKVEALTLNIQRGNLYTHNGERNPISFAIPFKIKVSQNVSFILQDDFDGYPFGSYRNDTLEDTELYRMFLQGAYTTTLSYKEVFTAFGRWTIEYPRKS